jgi:hypothetical protein
MPVVVCAGLTQRYAGNAPFQAHTESSSRWATGDNTRAEGLALSNARLSPSLTPLSSRN